MYKTWMAALLIKKVVIYSVFIPIIWTCTPVGYEELAVDLRIEWEQVNYVEDCCVYINII